MFPRGRGTESRFILVTGGARAGKSRFAQALGEQAPARRRFHLATGVACDREMASRIARHRRSRNGRWTTLEEPVHLPERLPRRFLAPGSLILLDCLPTFLTNLILQKQSDSGILRQAGSLFAALRRPGVTAVVVSNEVGLGIVPEHELGRRFRDLLGKVNQKAAQAADEVYLLVAGIPVRLK